MAASRAKVSATFHKHEINFNPRQVRPFSPPRPEQHLFITISTTGPLPARLSAANLASLLSLCNWGNINRLRICMFVFLYISREIITNWDNNELRGDVEVCCSRSVAKEKLLKYF